MEERIQKLMAQAGIASRREAEAMIVQGRVTVNGHRANLGDKADPASDDIRVDGARLRIESNRVYVMLNKPKGIVATVRAQEQETRRTVLDLVPIKEHLYPVGRLDADSEGLVLLTNDGELAQKLSHPRYEHPKVYEVTLAGTVPDEVLDIWRRGVVLDDGPTRPVQIKVLSRDKDSTRIQVTMREGRKRQIRRIATTLGQRVRRLVRMQLDTLKLGTLQPGEWRYLTEDEIQALQNSAESTPRHGKQGPRPTPTKARPRAAEKSPRAPARRRNSPGSGRKGGNPRRSSRTGASRPPRSGRPRRRSTPSRPRQSR